MVFLHALGSVATIIIMFMTGYALTHFGVLDSKSGDTFTRIIMLVSFPCYLIYSITGNFDRAKLFELSTGLIVPFLSIGITYIFGVIVSRIFKVKKGRTGVFRSIFFTSNTMLIGLTVNLALFGAESMPYVLLYYICNTLFFWSVGCFEIGKDGAGNQNRSFFSKDTLKNIFSPALITFFISLLLVVFGVKLPSFLLNSFQYIGSLTTPLAMFFTGIVLYSVKLGGIKIERDMVILIFARFLICPLTVLALEHFIHLPPLMAKVFVIQSAMPAMTNTGVVAKQYGADYEFAALTMVVTTFLSMIVIPVYMTLI